jgi:hypothetical protein
MVSGYEFFLLIILAMPLLFLEFSGVLLLVIFFLFSSFVAVDFDDLVFVTVDTVLLLAFW